jgi:NAD(P)-dependent dehydrogenase (short-subunit alcohol dehydrogenase family)
VQDHEVERRQRFDGKVALITGAAGGIGAATALAMAREGAAVALYDRKLELLEDIAEACRAVGAEVAALAVNQTDRQRVEDAAEEVAERLGDPTVVFANAGYGKFSTFLEQPLTEWQRHVDVNLTGTFHVCQVAARRLAAAKRPGAIVINASSGADTHSDQLSAYCTTKAGLRMLTTGMASELGVHRIRVNAVMPGVIETGMTGPMLANGDHRDVLLAETAVGRLGDPADVANAVCFLASDDAAFITGVSLMVDGGQTIHGHPRWFRLDYRQAHQEQWEVGR